jgi:hypothetical protein
MLAALLENALDFILYKECEKEVRRQWNPSLTGQGLPR